MRIYNAIVLVTLIAAAPAMAEQAADHRQVRVSYADINTASMAGMLVLRSRIQAASRNLCGSEPDSRDLNRREPYRSCVTQSVQRALDEIPKGSLASR
jgi:UrcA family protein